MSNRSMRDERQRVGAPGPGTLFGKKEPPGTRQTAPAPRETGAGKRRDRQIDKAMKDAGV